MMHAKTAVADGRWARVGSTNLNLASFIGNYELDVAVENAGFAAEMERQYLDGPHARDRDRPSTTAALAAAGAVPTGDGTPPSRALRKRGTRRRGGRPFRKHCRYRDHASRRAGVWRPQDHVRRGGASRRAFGNLGLVAQGDRLAARSDRALVRDRILDSRLARESELVGLATRRLLADRRFPTETLPNGPVSGAFLSTIVRSMRAPQVWTGWLAIAAMFVVLTAHAQAPPPAEQLVQAKAPPFSEGIFPCTQCHDAPGDKTAARARVPRRHPGDLRPRRRAPLVPRLPRQRRTATSCTSRAATPFRSPSRTGCAASATATSTATGAPACTASASAAGTARRRTSSA